MTPEREAQMREMYIAEFGERPNSAGSYREQDDADEWDVRLSGFLACARALEPMVRDAERYRAIRATGRDWSNLRVFDYRGALDAESLDEEADALINAAMSAALEEGNATE